MTDGERQRQALADKIRNDHVRSIRRKRLAIMFTIIALLLLGIALFTWYQSWPDPEDLESKSPENSTEQYGFTLTPELVTGEGAEQDELIQVEIYEDFLCDSCKIFGEESGPYLAELVQEGRISLTYYPISFLNSVSTDEYSQRAANAAVCVADEAGVLAYVQMHDLLFDNQPHQGGPGLSDEELLEFALEAGAEDVRECIVEQEFVNWVRRATAAGIEAEVSVTPTVRVGGLNVVREDDGREYMPGPEELEFSIDLIN